MSEPGSLALAFHVNVLAVTPEAAADLCSRLEGAGIRALSVPTLEVTPPGQIVVLTMTESDPHDRIERLARTFLDRHLIMVVPAELEAVACALWEQGLITDYVTADRQIRLPAIIRKVATTLSEPTATIESQWESLNRVLTSIREAASLDSIFRVATDDIGKLFGTDHAVVVRYYPELGVWMHEAENFGVAGRPPTVGFKIPDADNPIAEKLKRKQIVIVEDSTSLTDPVNKQVSDRFPGSWLLIPIVVKDEIWGSLSLLKRGGGAAWIVRQMTFSRILAEHLGMAIHQTQLIERLQHDIEERHQLYLALRESENRFRQIIGSSPIPFFLKDPERRYLYVNPAFEKLIGLSLDEVIGANPEDLPTAGLLKTCATGSQSQNEPATFEARLEIDRPHDLMVTQFPLLNETGETAAICGFLVDVTEQKNLIQTLREREQDLRLLESAVEHARDSIIITDTSLGDYPGQTIVYVNRALRELTGYSNEEILGRTPRMFQGAETSPETRRRIREALRDWESITVEILNYRKDGTKYWAELSIVPIRREDGIYTSWVAIQRDVTERRQFEQETRNLKKMEAIGQLTSGVAHNFNNILMIISGLAQLLHRRLGESSKESHQIQLIQNAAARGAELVKELMALSRTGSTQSALMDLNQVLRETVSMLEKVLPSDIELNLVLPPQPVFVEINQEKMVQSILNLAINARDAMPEGGALHIEIAMGPVETLLDAEGEYLPFPEDAHICLLEVRDTGIGMDSATQERIFEPFFTTKEVGHGTGLGLFSVFGFVYESGGIIRVISSPGQGTRFRMAFPLSRKIPVPEMPEGGATDTAPRLPEHSILLVEDEPDTRDLLQEMLEDGGLRVILAANGEEAVRIAQETPDGFDLLITDWVMPKMSGRVLIGVITQTYPSLPIIIMTGNFDLSLPPGFDPARFFFLTKPFSQVELLETVNRALHSPFLRSGEFKDLLSE